MTLAIMNGRVWTGDAARPDLAVEAREGAADPFPDSGSSVPGPCFVPVKW